MAIGVYIISPRNFQLNATASLPVILNHTIVFVNNRMGNIISVACAIRNTRWISAHIFVPCQNLSWIVEFSLIFFSRHPSGKH
jgi:hypothetical protein